MRQDYVDARFLEWWSYHPRLFKPDIFPVWMQYECKIADPVLKTNQMMQEGYLREGTFEEQLKRLTVSELKNICSDQNLSKGKKKQDIINIIINEADREKIDLAPVVVLSENGKQYIEDHSALLSNSYDCIEEYLIRDVDDNITGVSLDKYIIDDNINDILLFLSF